MLAPPLRSRLVPLALGAGLLLVLGCASMGTRLEPPDVALIGIEALPSEGNLEQRLRLRVRVTNPNDVPLVFDGIDLRLDLNGQRLGRALGNERHTIPRLDDGIVDLVATTSLFSILRQIVALPEQQSIDYAIQGRIFLADSPGWLRVEREGQLADLGDLRRGRFGR
ncbi:MAG: LEA type 2 family protein [Myxococcota bacterium]